jgi:hypothetical protein
MLGRSIFSGHASHELGLHAASLIFALTRMFGISPYFIMMETLAISSSISGALVSIMWISHVVSQYPAGRFAD